MATVSFFIRTNKSNKFVPVRARFSDGKKGIDLFAHTNEAVIKEHWTNKKGGSVRNLSDATYKTDVNAKLSNIRHHVEKEYSKLKDLPAKEWLQKTIDRFYNPEAHSNRITLNDYFEKRAKTLRKHYRGLTTATNNALQEYATHTGKTEIDFNDISLDLRNSFVAYLYSKGYRTNSIFNYLNIIKVVVRRAYWDGLTSEHIFKIVNNPNFKIREEKTEPVFLTIDELKKIENADIPQRCDTFEATRDLFLIGCWTGQRFGDWNKISYSNIKTNASGEKTIVFTQQKTQEKVSIPLLPPAEKILNKYNGVLPKASALNHFIERLREICRIAGINEPINVTKVIGVDHNNENIEVTVKKKKWELVASHTARRSFASNMYQHYRIPSLTIKAVTRHKTEKSFLKYIRVTEEKHAEIMRSIWNETENRVQMKVVNE